MMTTVWVENIATLVYFIGGITCLTGLLFIAFTFLEAIWDKICLWRGVLAVMKMNRELFTKENRDMALKNRTNQTLPGIALISMERRKQLGQWGIEHDLCHQNGELWKTAVLLLDEDMNPEFDAWGLRSKYKGNTEKRLQVAGALIVAEIDRIRMEKTK